MIFIQINTEAAELRDIMRNIFVGLGIKVLAFCAALLYNNDDQFFMLMKEWETPTLLF